MLLTSNTAISNERTLVGQFRSRGVLASTAGGISRAVPSNETSSFETAIDHPTCTPNIETEPPSIPSTGNVTRSPSTPAPRT